tara:strand:+ start:2000 stop:2146 length:147 start_codon:yes stop_codon:yes gene_type:complete
LIDFYPKLLLLNKEIPAGASIANWKNIAEAFFESRNERGVANSCYWIF